MAIDHNTMRNDQLKLALADESDVEFRECDGCGSRFVLGQKMITGIESCCGGCYRVLCDECVRFAFRLIEGKTL